MTLGDYNIASGSVVQLMRLLYAIPGGSLLDNIVFDLYWGYPVHGTFDSTHFYTHFPHIKSSSSIIPPLGSLTK